ncbi:MoaD/ThiS family protein [Neisseria sp. S1]|uniref:MoaD/ThiS family protein n=1 Tax=Neisseria sp. S1 TaxID=3318354 RepID=UPI003A88DE31
MITILYFGVLKQQLATAQEQLEWQGGSGRELLELLQARGDTWREALAEDKIFRLVINKKISNWEDYIPSDAEVGLLPPVTGG